MRSVKLTPIKSNELEKLVRSPPPPDFSSFSPTDYRYKVNALIPFLSEEAFVAYKSWAEIALARASAKRKIVPTSVPKEIAKSAESLKAQEVYDEEKKTHHDIIAQLNVLKRRIASEEAKSGLHKPATSMDIVETANSLRYRDAFNAVIIPDIGKLMRAWITIIRKESEVLEIGRTHLQHAEPITFGFATAWFLDRLGNRILEIESAANSLVGKFSGAVGAYNGHLLFVKDPEKFEREVLAESNIKPADISTQIIQPEFVTNLVNYCLLAYGVMANWANDMRHLMRPELAEVWLPSDSSDISISSTMSQKQNPIGFENIVSLWRELKPKIETMYDDLISENNRDLLNSASQRYTPEIFGLFDFSVRRATRISNDIHTSPENMTRNFEMSKHLLMAEPLQILLSSLGRHTAHEEVARLSRVAASTGRSVVDLAFEDKDLKSYMERLTEGQLDLLTHPEKYLGLSKTKPLDIADKWEGVLKKKGLWDIK